MFAITFAFVVLEVVVFGILGFVLGVVLCLLYRIIKKMLRMLWRGTRWLFLRKAAP